MAGLLDFGVMDDPQTMGLLSLAMGLMSPGRNPGRASFGEALSNGLMSGMQGYGAAKKAQAELEDKKALRDYHAGMLGVQQDEMRLKREQSAAKQEQLKQFSNDLAQYGLTGFTPEMLARYKMAGIDVGDIYNHATKPAAGLEHGLNPTVGLNPATGKLEYFVPAKNGEPKWLGISAPPQNQVIPPTDYRPGAIVDKRNPAAPPVLLQMPGAAPAEAPTPPGAPPRQYPGVVSPKVADTMRAEEYKAGEKELAQLRQSLQGHRAMLPEYEKFGELNRQHRTGGFDDQLGLSKYNPLTATMTREMEAITSRLTPQQRPVGSGATSDFEQRLYRLGTVSVDNPGDTNQKIRQQFKDILSLGERELKFKENWLQKYGTLNGATEAWSKVADKPEGPAKVVVQRGLYNGRRVVKYSDGTVDYAD